MLSLGTVSGDVEMSEQHHEASVSVTDRADVWRAGKRSGRERRPVGRGLWSDSVMTEALDYRL